MGFLNDLKKVGFGNTGPYGRMDSGATNYARYTQERHGLESERGVTQALALAAKDGVEIPFKTQAEIAEKWRVPLSAVTQRARVLNDQFFAESTKKKLHTAAQLYMSDKNKDPNLVPNEKYLMKLFQKAGLSDPRQWGVAKDAIIKLRDESKTLAIGPYDDVVSITNNKLNVLHEGQKKPPPAGTKEKVSTWRLSDNRVVRSYDEGRTYVGPNGKRLPMPTEGAYKVSAQMSGADIDTLKSKENALEDIANAPKEKRRKLSAKSMAAQGTGPWAMVEASVDAVAGGIGLDKLVGKDGFFKTTQEARQDLRLIKQLGKSALMNSSRGLQWEQQRIEDLFPDPGKFFANPRTEARKFASVRRALLTEQSFNNIAISQSPNASEINKLKQSNLDIQRLLAHIGDPQQQTGGQQELSDDDLIKMYSK